MPKFFPEMASQKSSFLVSISVSHETDTTFGDPGASLQTSYQQKLLLKENKIYCVNLRKEAGFLCFMEG
jgi:hypothetical protein